MLAFTAFLALVNTVLAFTEGALALENTVLADTAGRLFGRIRYPATACAVKAHSVRTVFFVRPVSTVSSAVAPLPRFVTPDPIITTDFRNTLSKSWKNKQKYNYALP